MIILRGVRSIFAVLSFTLVAGAQPVINVGKVEVAGFGGIAAGIGRTAAGVGGNIGVAPFQKTDPSNPAKTTGKWLMAYFETTYFPNLLNKTVSEQIPVSGLSQPRTATGVFKASFTDVHGGVHLRYQSADRPQWVPYGSFGVGVLQRSSASINFTIPELNVNVPIQRPGQSELAFNGGGGIRWYLKENFGTRMEVKLYKPTGTLIAGKSDPFVKVTFGVFYNWSGSN